uniref:Uncharacterized protein n=1 Tax=Heterorhabditis bacteriophora TaxID=37862 RepID=A0A1I7XII0_HETBA
MADGVSPGAADEFVGRAATPSQEGTCLRSSRYALRRRRSIQQKDEEGCTTSSLAATADEATADLGSRCTQCNHAQAPPGRSARQIAIEEQRRLKGRYGLND